MNPTIQLLRAGQDRVARGRRNGIRTTAAFNQGIAATGSIEIGHESHSVFPNKPFAIRHNLSDNSLFSLEKLAELAVSLPRDHIEYNSGKVAIDQRPEDTPLVELEPAEIVRRIREVSAWMVLKQVEVVPAYRALLHHVLDGVAREMGHRSAADAGFLDIQGFIFVSSADSTTPFHADTEDNFFVQLHGDKYFHVIDNHDRSVVSDIAYETALSVHRNLSYRPQFEDRATVFTMKAGDGCFVPYMWPHWVRTGGTYSISMAITWKSAAVTRTNKVLLMNAALRKLGFPQLPPGRRPSFDAIKAGVYTAARALFRPLRHVAGLHVTLRGMLLGQTVNHY